MGPLVYLQDLYLGKTTTRDGTQWTGVYNNRGWGEAASTVVLAGVKAAVARGGFTLIFNRLNYRSPGVHALTRSLELEVRPAYTRGGRI